MNNVAAAENIKEIFKKLEINKIVYVDDEFQLEISDILYAKNIDAIVQKFFPKIKIDDLAVRNDQIIKEWENLKPNAKEKIRRIVQFDTDFLSEIYNAFFPIFLEIIPNDILSIIPPGTWEKEKEEWLQDSETTLFLFDQDLKIREGSSKDGIKIIADISRNREIICGLITRTVKIEDCLTQRDIFCEEYPILRDKFIVIPKEAVTTNRSLFIYLLKMTILSKHFSVFKNTANSILDNVFQSSKKKVDEISVEDFDHIVFKTPGKEGSWEPDMFFRIYSHFQRREYFKSVYTNEDIQKTIAKIRSVSNIPTKPVDFFIPSNAWNIQHNELYENAIFLNKNHLPLEIGDIFAKTTAGSTKKYILLAQPCDLMIRPDGTRARSGNRFNLLEIKCVKKSKEMPYNINNDFFKEEVPYLDISQEKMWFINFKDVKFVKDYILDICVYNDDGLGKFISNYKADKEVRPSLINRYTKIVERIEKELRVYKDILDELYDKQSLNINSIRSKLTGHIFQDELFEGKYEEHKKNYIITFNYQRVGRLKFERATGLLTKYYSVIQRPAFDADYGHERDIQSSEV